MINFACPQCAKELNFPDDMAGEEAICDCGAMFTAPNRARENSGTRDQHTRAHVGRAALPHGVVTDEPRSARPRLTIATGSGRQWIGIAVLGMLYFIVPVLVYRPSQFMTGGWAEALRPEWKVWLDLTLDASAWGVLVPWLIALGELSIRRARAVFRLRLACLLFVVLYIVGAIMGILHVFLTPVEMHVNAEYIAESGGTISGIVLSLLRLIFLGLAIPVTIFVWSRKLDGMKWNDTTCL